MSASLDDRHFAVTAMDERPYLRALCARHLVIPDEAEDAVQDALLRAWRVRERMPGDVIGRHRWLTTIALNGVYDRNRHEQTGKRILPLVRLPVADDPERTTLLNLAMAATIAGLGMVSDGDATAILRNVDESGAALGATWDISAAGAKSRVRRARARLREVMQERVCDV